MIFEEKEIHSAALEAARTFSAAISIEALSIEIGKRIRVHVTVGASRLKLAPVIVLPSEVSDHASQNDDDGASATQYNDDGGETLLVHDNFVLRGRNGKRVELCDQIVVCRYPMEKRW